MEIGRSPCRMNGWGCALFPILGPQLLNRRKRNHRSNTKASKIANENGWNHVHTVKLGECEKFCRQSLGQMVPGKSVKCEQAPSREHIPWDLVEATTSSGMW